MKKLSEAFVEFIEPALEFFGSPEPMSEPHDAACAIGHLTWNAVVLEDLNPGAGYVVKAKAQGGDVPEINALIDRLVLRKKELFDSDKRIIGVYDIRKKLGGTYSLWAEIHQDLCLH